jgi:hypothetical protein
MKAIRLFITAAVLLLLGVWALFAKFKGNLDIHLGWPLADTSLQISGAATGGWVLTGILLLLGAVVAFLWALIASIVGRSKVPAAECSSAENGDTRKLTP